MEHTKVKQKTFLAADPAIRRDVVMRASMAIPHRIGGSQ